MAELSSAKLFQGLPEREMKQIEREFKEVRHQAGNEIMVLGKSGVGFMVIADGEVEVTLPDGRKRTMGPGDSFGEMSLLDHEGRSASVMAKTDVRLYSMPEWSFKSFLTSHPEVSYRLLQSLSRRVRRAESGE